MPQYTQKTNNTFVKGLITEAGPLTFPEDASVDELNCDLLRDGSRRRRLALEYETGYALSTEMHVASTVTITDWKNVGNEANVEFAVVQLGAHVSFYQHTSGALSANRVDTTSTSGVEYTLDLAAYERPSSNGASTAPIQCSSINGALVITSKEIEPLLVERNSSTGAFTVTQISFKVRDFEWMGDTSEYYDDSATNPPSVARQYDTANVGWAETKGAAALSTYAASESAYPPLTMPWYAGKDASNNFSVSAWQKIYAGTSLAANGHYILDLWTKDRDTASGLTGVSSGQEDARFSTSVGYAGRVFYSGLENSTDNNSSKIFFSQILEEGFDAVGKLYQRNDPTAEYFSDLLDTDGGFIVIPEAYNIKRLHVFGARLFVFAENGVWSVSGVDDVFRATEYSVNKISNVGLENLTSFVSANGRPYWWSNLGIHTLTVDDRGVFYEQSISLGTIQTFWNSINADSRDDVRSTYDAANKKVFWFYTDSDNTGTNNRSKILVFDETLNAFYPWSIPNINDNSYVVAATFYGGQGTGTVEYTVTDSDGNIVVDSSGNTVVVERAGRQYASSEIKVLIADGPNTKYTFAEFTGTDFLDLSQASYSSYLVTGYDFMGDIVTSKTSPYISVVMGVTETGWTDTGAGYDPVRGSSILVSNYWDFKTSAASASQQAYRLKKLPVVDPNDLGTFGYPYTVISTKLRLRGRGKSMNLKFESERGKDFHLIGWSTIGERKGRF